MFNFMKNLAWVPFLFLAFSACSESGDIQDSSQKGRFFHSNINGAKDSIPPVFAPSEIREKLDGKYPSVSVQALVASRAISPISVADSVAPKLTPTPAPVIKEAKCDGKSDDSNINSQIDEGCCICLDSGVHGDTNGDGKVTVMDLVCPILISGSLTTPPENPDCQDINRDGLINIEDAVAVGRIKNGL